MLIWLGAWTWQSWLSDKIGFNDKNTTPGRPDCRDNCDSLCLMMITGCVRVSVSGWHLHHLWPHLWPGQANADMGLDMKIAWSAIIKFSLTFIRSVPICSGLTAVSPRDQIFWLRLTLRCARVIMARPCVRSAVIIMVLQPAALQSYAAGVSDHYSIAVKTVKLQQLRITLSMMIRWWKALVRYVCSEGTHHFLF